MAVTEADVHEARQRAWDVFTRRRTVPVVDGATILASAPVRGLSNDAGIRQAITTPLADGLLDARWRPDVVMAGQHGDALWTAHTGTISGLFVGELWGVPPSGRHAELRYGEFTRVVDGEVVELRVLADLPGLAAGAGWHLFPDAAPAGAGWSGRPAAELDPSRRVCDGIDTELTRTLFDRLRDGVHHDDLFAPTARRWSCHGLDQVPEDELAVGSDVRIVDGEFAASCSWPTDGGTPSMMFFVRDGDRFVASWTLVDLIHRAATRGDDLLARS